VDLDIMIREYDKRDMWRGHHKGKYPEVDLGKYGITWWKKI